MDFFKRIVKSITGEKGTPNDAPTPKEKDTRTEKTDTPPEPDKKRGKGKKKRTEKQLACNAEFQAQRRLYTAFRAVVMVVCPAWELFAAWMKRVAHSGDNCFHAMNYKYMKGDKVACPRLFHFSVGELAMPWNMEAARQGNVVLFTWHDDRDCPHARGTDRLMVGVLYDEYRGRPVLIDPHALRSQGAASITLDPKYGKRVHVYPFFERANKRAYSDDQHFEV